MPSSNSFTQATISQLVAHLAALSRSAKPRNPFDRLDGCGQAVVFLTLFGVIICAALNLSEYILVFLPISSVALVICWINARGGERPPRPELSSEQLRRLKGVIHLLKLLSHQHNDDDRLDLTVNLDEELMLCPEASATTAWLLIVGELAGARYRARLIGSEGVSRVEVDLDLPLPADRKLHRAVAALYKVEAPEGFATNTVEPRGQVVRVGLISRERLYLDAAVVATAAALRWRGEGAMEASEADGDVYR